MLPFLKRFLPELGWGLCLALALALARSDLGGAGGGVRVWADALAAPAQRWIAGGRALAGRARTGWGELDALARENRRLREAELAAAAQAQELQQLRAENGRLEATLRLAKQLPLSTRGARILQFERSPDAPVLIIRGDRLEGLSGSHALITGDGIIGRTLSCGAATCRAIPLTDPDFGISLIDERSRLLINAEGNGTQLLTLHGISTGDDIRDGDLLLSSGLDGLFPRGLAVGRVVNLNHPGDSGPEGELRPVAAVGNGLTLLVVE
jgi:rod shape-determining protein MreC